MSLYCTQLREGLLRVLQWQFTVYNTNVDTTCMGEPGRTNRRSTEAREAHGARVSVHAVGRFEQLLQFVVLTLGDPWVLLGSILLGIFRVSQTDFTSSCIIVHYIKSDNQFPSISQNNQIAEAPSHPLLNLPFNPKRAGGGGIRPPLDVSRDNFAENFFRAASFHDFFLSSFAQLLALFSEKSGVWFESYAILCTRASAQNLKIFWICVQNIWKMASCAKTPFWALKCNICIHDS